MFSTLAPSRTRQTSFLSNLADHKENVLYGSDLRDHCNLGSTRVCSDELFDKESILRVMHACACTVRSLRNISSCKTGTPGVHESQTLPKALLHPHGVGAAPAAHECMQPVQRETPSDLPSKCHKNTLSYFEEQISVLSKNDRISVQLEDARKS